jgi:hypothetical protein
MMAELEACFWAYADYIFMKVIFTEWTVRRCLIKLMMYEIFAVVCQCSGRCHVYLIDGLSSEGKMDRCHRNFLQYLLKKYFKLLSSAEGSTLLTSLYLSTTVTADV